MSAPDYLFTRAAVAAALNVDEAEVGRMMPSPDTLLDKQPRWRATTLMDTIAARHAGGRNLDVMIPQLEALWQAMVCDGHQQLLDPRDLVGLPGGAA